MAFMWLGVFIMGWFLLIACAFLVRWIRGGRDNWASFASLIRQEAEKAESLLFGVLALVIEIVGWLYKRALGEVQKKERVWRFVVKRDLPAISRILFYIVPSRSREHIIGDLEEEYQAIILLMRGPFRARWWWWRQVFGIVGRYVWRRMRRLLALEVVRRWRRR